jgi:hypothetical protein
VNTPPTVDSLSLSPQAALYTNDLVSAITTLGDVDTADTPSAEFAWFVDGQQVSETSDVLDGATFFEKGDPVYVVATPTDGTDTGVSSTSSTLTVLNSAPTAPEISVSPTNPEPGQDDLVCTVDTASTDADGDTLTYGFEWDVDGSPFTSATDTSMDSTVDALLTLSGEEWTCTVTPDDGSSPGPSVAESVWVSSGCTTLTVGSGSAGIPSYVDIGRPTSLAQSVLGDTFTVEVWAKRDGTNTQSPNSSSAISSVYDRNGWVLRTEGTNTWVAAHYVGTVWLVVRGSGEEWNQWQHVAAVFDDSSGSAVIHLFVDGELVGTGTDSNSFTSDGNEYFVIGNMNEQNTSSPGQIRQFFGSLSEARISSGARYTTAFTPDGYFSADATTLAHWPLSEGSGTTVEETLGSADGTLVGGGYTEDCQYDDADGDGYAAWEDCDDTDATVWGGTNPCPECTSLEFDGSGDYVEVAHNSDLSFAGSDYTFEWWVLLDGAAGGPVLSKRGSGSGSGYNLATYVDSLIASNGCCGGGNSMYFNTVEYPSYDVDAASGWHHVALTHDAQNTVSTYWLDGIAVGDSTTFSSLGANTQSLWFGRERVNTGVYSELTLGGIQVADAVLYSAPFTPVWPLVSNANTVSLWTMEEGGGSTLSDSSSNAYDGTIHGSASWSTSCPAEDIDGDGYAAWEDCDDTDATVWGGTNPCPECSSLHGADVDTPSLTWDMSVGVTAEAWVKVQSDAYLTSGNGLEMFRLFTHPSPGCDADSGSASVEPATDHFLATIHGNQWGSAIQSTGALPLEAWVHMAVEYSSSASRLYIDGVLEATAVGATTCTGSMRILNYELNSTGGLDGVQISDVRIHSGLLYGGTNFDASTTLEATGSELIYYPVAAEGGTSLIDSSGNGHDATVSGGTWVQECPAADDDNDGYAAWEDCDDNNALIGATCLGSCLEILNAGASTGDGTYWIDPNGSGRFEVYCDMSTDGGGWTHVMNLNGANATNYDSADVFETKGVFGTMTDDNYLNPGFYSIEFTESYLVDETYNTIVISDTAYANTSNGTQIDQLLANPGSTEDGIWQLGVSSKVMLYDGSTNDGQYQTGDLRIFWDITESDTSDLAYPVTPVWGGDNHILIVDSDYGYAGARTSSGHLNISSSGVDNRFELFLR